MDIQGLFGVEFRVQVFLGASHSWSLPFFDILAGCIGDVSAQWSSFLFERIRTSPAKNMTSIRVDLHGSLPGS